MWKYEKISHIVVIIVNRQWISKHHWNRRHMQYLTSAPNFRESADPHPLPDPAFPSPWESLVVDRITRKCDWNLRCNMTPFSQPCMPELRLLRNASGRRNRWSVTVARRSRPANSVVWWLSSQVISHELKSPLVALDQPSCLLCLHFLLHHLEISIRIGYI